MLMYDNYYKKFGTRKLKHFVYPRIISGADFVFPKLSLLYYHKVSDIPQNIDRTIPILSSNTKCVVYSVYKYNDETLGKFHNSTTKPNSLITQLQKNEKTFKFIKPNAKSMKIQNNQLFIVNYANINALFKYNNHPLNNYFKWHNLTKTMVENINNNVIKNSRNIFINFDIPVNLLPLLKLNKYASIPINRVVLENMVNYKHLNILDLWRAMDTDTRKDSVIGNLTKENIDKITLLISVDDKVVMVKLKYILGLNKDYDLDVPFTKYNAMMSRKILYLFFTKLILNSSNSLSDIENDAQMGENGLAALTEFKSDINDEQEINIDDELALTEDISVAKLEDDTPEVDDSDDDIMDELNNISMSEEVDPDIPVENIDEVKEHQYTYNDSISKLEKLKDDKVISKAVYTRISKTIEAQTNEVSGYAGDTLTNVLDTSKDDISISNEDTAVTDTASVIDKTSNDMTNEVLRKKYITEVYKKDIVRSIYAIQTNDVFIESHEVVEDESIMGATESHIITVTGVDGTKSKLKLILPKINEDGTFTVAGNQYFLRQQKNDIPIKKINEDTVTLSSNYGSKLFISKNLYAKDNVGMFLQRHIVKLYNSDPKLKDLVLFKVNVPGVKLPYIYSTLATHIKSFKYDDVVYMFDYKSRKSIIKNDMKLNDIEDKKHVLVGMDKDTPIVIDSEDRLFKVVNGKHVENGTLLDVLQLQKDDLLSTFSVLKIFNNKVPTGLVISYYLKLSKVLKLLGTKYEKVKSDTKVKLLPNQYKITFNDYTLIVNKDYAEGDLALVGLSNINNILSKYNMSVLDKRDLAVSIFSDLGFSLLYINELKLLEKMFVDPITKTILEEIKEPLNLIGLIVRSNELLVDNNYKNPNDITSSYIKGYDRIAGMVYKELISSMRTNNNASYFGKSKMTIDPYTILKKIGNDNTTVLVDDLNPIAQMKQTEDVTLTGEGGRSKEAINFIARELDPTEIGIYSESSKDSGDVGINSYLSSNPNIVNIRGMAEPTDKVEYSNVLSTTSMTMPFSIHDDPKRTNFATIQSTHTVPMNEMRAPYVRTGYETVLAVRAGDKFVISAEDECVVTEVTKTKVTVKFKDGKTKSYKLKEWTTKEESGSCYTHRLVSNVSVKDKLRKDDTIVYDELFFEPDLFDKQRVIFKQGTIVRVAFKEDMETFEDSTTISTKLNKRLGTVSTKVKTFILDGKDEAVDMVVPGDKVKSTTPLFTIADASLGTMKGLDEKTIAILQDIKSSTPKAKVDGTISKIVIYYNGEPDDFSSSVKELITKYDKVLKSETGYTGKVNNSFSIDGKPIMPGEVVIKIYINVNVGMGIGDKAIIGNQLKCTVGEAYNYSITTEDGRDVEMLFSTRSLSARIVNSPFLIGTTSTLLSAIEDKITDMYFN